MHRGARLRLASRAAVVGKTGDIFGDRKANRERARSRLRIGFDTRSPLVGALLRLGITKNDLAVGVEEIISESYVLASVSADTVCVETNVASHEPTTWQALAPSAVA